MKVLVIDVETIGLEDVTAFEISWVISDIEGGEVEKNAYLVDEVWNSKLVEKAFYYESNKDRYKRMLELGEITILSILEIKNKLLKDILREDVKYLAAFNIKFDLKSLSKTFISNSVSKKTITFSGLEKFITPIDIGISFALLDTNNKNLYKDFCKKIGAVTAAGNIRTTAEAMYRFIKMDKNINEEHIGVLDCIIELEILQYSYIVSKKKEEFLKEAYKATVLDKKAYLYFK